MQLMMMGIARMMDTYLLDMMTDTDLLGMTTDMDLMDMMTTQKTAPITDITPQDTAQTIMVM